MIILGLNAFHADASACLVRDGKIAAAAEEERFRRIKHWAGFPSQAIRFCLEDQNLSIGDVDAIAINSDPRTNSWRRIGYALRNSPDPRLIIDRIKNRSKRMGIEDELKQAFPGQTFHGRVARVDHHLSHLASAFLVSPFPEAVAVSVDGFGDFASASWGMGRGSSLTLDGRVWFPHSLGIFYQALTQYLGFKHYGDEYKVMGLAPYGEPRFLNEMRRIVKLGLDGTFALDLSYFRHHREKIAYTWDGGTPQVGTLYSPELEALLGPARNPNVEIDQRHRDIARSTQAMYEEAYFHLLRALHGRYRLDELTLAGGCAMNSVANGKVIRQTPFKRLYVQAAAGDAGGAIGAAMYTWHRLGGNTCADEGMAGRFEMDRADFGPRSSSEAIADLLQAHRAELGTQGCTAIRLSCEADICERASASIAEGKVVGWFQGRMEWGPRALGHRSILGDPRRADMKDILNIKIKRRESFRPFAPSILREHVREWFEEDADVPFMMQVFQVRPEKHALIPAVTHVDGSGRLQTVAREASPLYWRLIEAFHRRTGVPMVLNTSFNENEPIVCQPQEALDCFMRTRMDVLVLENWFISRAA